MRTYITRGLKAFLLITVFVSSSAFAQDEKQLLAQVGNILAKPAALQVSFVQAKQLKGFRQPVVSTGRVLIAQQRGVLWVTEKPYQSTLKMTSSGVSEIRGGQTTQIGNPQSMKAMSSILSGLLAGDFSPLQKYFHFSGDVSKGTWSLKLTPADNGVARAVRLIQVSGARYVNRIIVEEANGDRSNISFSAATPIAASMVGL